jgi:hypothetical protein
VLAVQAYEQAHLSEGELARYLRTDRVSAREIVAETLSSRDVDAGGQEQTWQVPQRSLMDLAGEEN